MALARLQQRGLLKQVTHQSLDSLNKANAIGKPWSVYLGIDPTADGLHVGHLLGVLTLQHFQQSGYRPIALVGGATGLIGDPSGRTNERPFLTEEHVYENVLGLKNDLSTLLDFEEGNHQAKLVNNLDWYKDMSAIDLIRGVGRHFRVGPMMARESMKSRLESSGGLSFTEFTYQLLQGYDFLQLYREHNCMVQVGGSDQWGNILSGCELIKKVEGVETYGVTTPLLTTGGKKFGKSEGNAIWLNRSKTSDYAFYQYFLQIPDEEVGNFLSMLTHVPMEEIQEVIHEHEQAPFKRIGQTKLASELLKLVRGDAAVQRAARISDMMFGKSKGILPLEDVLDLIESKQVPVEKITSNLFSSASIIDLALAANCVKSKGECRRLVKNGGLSLNGERVQLDQLDLTLEKFQTGSTSQQYVSFRTGKKNYRFLVLE